MPVCGVLNSIGAPLHPPSVNNSRGRVKVTRQLGGSPGVPMGLREITSVVGDQVLQRKHVYTGGTWKGFVNRMKKQMSRKTVPVVQTLGVSVGSKVDESYALKMLDTWMPRTGGGFPGLDEDLFETLLSSIKVTANASAGAPYWRNKGDCMEDILNVGLPMVVKAIKEGKLEELRTQNPEMFLCEVKNKLDRYETSKLEDKTRPYTCVPAHWAFLFSILTQGFQHGLKTFAQDPESSNAYGFSSSDGGLNAMYDWMMSADKRGKVVVYGDDACLVVRRGKKVYRVDPDFQQMDGSLDRQDISLTIKWVVRHIRRDSDDAELSSFWKTVCDVWLEMASDPQFILDGLPIYRKKSKNGLMTGVPGTTLFDTVKSCIAWNSYLDFCSMGGKDPLSETEATSFMKKAGLVVKPGTWKPAIVPTARDGVLLTDHKFLGIQMLAKEWDGQIVIVPHLPYEDALEMLVVQKDNPFEKRTSHLASSRTLFDRMRGLMITFGFSDPDIVRAIHAVVNSIPAEAILMTLQNEKGEKPDHITLQDFSYPDSSGFPTEEFCMSLYAGTERRGWTQLFPDLMPILDVMRDERRALQPTLKRDAATGLSRVSFDVKDVAVQCDPVLETTWTTAPKQKANLHGGFNPRSKVVDLKGVEKKSIPNLPQVCVNYLEEYGGIIEVGRLQGLTGAESSSTLVNACQRAHLYVTGHGPNDLVSVEPVQTPLPTLQEKVDAKVKEDKGLINRTTVVWSKFPRDVNKQSPVITNPDLVFVDMGVITSFPGLDAEVKDVDAAFRTLNSHLARNFYVMSWKVMQVNPKADNPVPVRLLIYKPGHPEDSVIVAEARSISAKLAKSYIARTLLDCWGCKLAESLYTVKVIPPPQPDSWADEVEEPLNREWRKPAIVDVPRADEEVERLKHVDRLSEMFPQFRYAVPILLDDYQTYDLDLDTAQKKVEQLLCQAEYLSKLEDVDQLTVSPPETDPEPSCSSSSDCCDCSETLSKVLPSKRSKFTPEKRTRLNRKTHEKRVKKLKSLK